MSRKSIAGGEYQLSIDQIEEFNEKGYLGPFELCSPDEMAEVRSDIEEQVLNAEGLSNEDISRGRRSHCRHLDLEFVYDLCSHPSVVERMASIYGDDLVLWRSNFFMKQPGAKEIPWHQDTHFWPIEPPITISAWVAIDEVTTENACIEVIPGSHKRLIPHVGTTDEVRFNKQADPSEFDPDEAVEMELKPGEFFLFNERTLHRSKANTSDDRRLGLSVRVTLPITHVDHDEIMISDTISQHRNVLLAGEDDYGFNETVRSPFSDAE